MAYGVLVIEDEAALARTIKAYLERHGCDVRTADNGAEGLQQVTVFKPDVVLLDLHLPDMHGLDILARLRQHDIQAKVVIITAQSSVQTAVDAMKAGASDYVSKPLILAELRLLLDKVVEQTRQEGILSYYQDKLASDSGPAYFIGASPPVRALQAQMYQVLEAEQRLREGTLPAMFIMGETGTGKELVARALHDHSQRQGQPFVELNCATLPEQLLETELFGYEPGAFTDAKGRKLGLLEAAHGGTLFLDEVGELALPLQSKLLKVLEDKNVRRLGGVRDRQVDVRIIAATNRSLKQAVQQGTFRADLFFRLCVLQFVLPPLRQRGHDIVLLAQHFLELHCRRYGRALMRFSTKAEQVLLRYPWPGNVRELRNVVEQVVLLAQQEVIEPEHLPLLPGLLPPPPDVEAGTGQVLLPPQGLRLDEVERDLVQQALERTVWNVTQAAKLLGLSRDTLRYRIDKYHLKSPKALFVGTHTTS